MKLVGYIARYPDGTFGKPYGRGSFLKVYKHQKVAQKYHPKASIIPVYIPDAPAGRELL